MFWIPSDWADPSYVVFPVAWMWRLIVPAYCEIEVAAFLLWPLFSASEDAVTRLAGYPGARNVLLLERCGGHFVRPLRPLRKSLCSVCEQAHRISAQACFLLEHPAISLLSPVCLKDPVYVYKPDLNNFKHVAIYDIVAYGS